MCAQSCSTLFDPMDYSMPGFPVLHYLQTMIKLWIWSNSCLLSQWCYPTISSSATPSPFALNLSQHQNLFPISQLFILGGQSTGTSPSASVLPTNIQGLIPFRIDWLDLLAVQGTQESPPAPQFKSIDSSVLSLLYGPTFIVHDYWKNHFIDYPDLCQWRLCFLICCLGLS